MPIRLYNSLTKGLQDFVPQNPERVTMYTCGPTVYGRPHIGNYSSFLMADLLRRWLEVSGYTVQHAKNITDVGHLVHDADHGDDKIQKEAEQKKLHPLEVARLYTEQYVEDEKALSMVEPEERPRASAYIKEMLAMVKDLLQKGNAYELEDAVYFAVESATRTPYGELSGNVLKNMKAGARVDVHAGKKHPADFALWKKCIGENGSHILRWSYDTGEVVTSSGEDASAGFPGWHIECSAMSRSLLGDTIDVHTGGEDNIFPHHECEIAQSEAVTNKQFVRFWLHRRRIDLGDAKMSKSLGNVLTLDSISEKGFSAMDLRYYLLSVHYRTNLKFTWRGLEDAHKARKKVVEWIQEVKNTAHFSENNDPMAEMTLKNFRTVMDEDLNTPAALAEIFASMTYFRSHGPWSKATHAQWQEFAELIQRTFGCFAPEQTESIPAQVQSLVDERAKARAAKNFAESDRLRDAIKTLGYEVRDSGKEQSVRRL